jgi:hypothetical protein
MGIIHPLSSSFYCKIPTNFFSFPKTSLWNALQEIPITVPPASLMVTNLRAVGGSCQGLVMAGELQDMDQVALIPEGTLDTVVNVRANESTDYKYLDFDLLNSSFQKGITTAIVDPKNLVKIQGIVCTIFTENKTQIVKIGMLGTVKTVCGSFIGKIEKVVS